MTRDPFWSLVIRRLVRSAARSQRGTVLPNMVLNVSLVVLYLTTGMRFL